MVWYPRCMCESCCDRNCDDVDVDDDSVSDGSLECDDDSKSDGMSTSVWKRKIKDAILPQAVATCVMASFISL